ncbi:MAG: lipoate--protein ligase family protein [Candidatus Aminicenantes bacterium]|nr:lipoate--protein ligase family protein [Candidatus Aminicenantes bacterium]
MKEWDLIIDEIPMEGAWNMAVDEYLFRSVQEGTRTFLRFYRWKRPTLSLGNSQKFENVLDKDACQKHGIDVVRRITGGKLVLHHRELTYCLCSSETDTFTDTLQGSYRMISEALVLGLKKMGIDAALTSATPSHYARRHSLCFSAPAQNEIEVDGKKIIGSAQKRKGDCFLQHGSIPTEEDESLLHEVSYFDKQKESIHMTSLQTLLKREINFEEGVDYLSRGFCEYFHIGLNPHSLGDSEKAVIEDIRHQKYGNSDWTVNRIEAAKF